MRNHRREKIITIGAALFLTLVFAGLIFLMLGKGRVENYTSITPAPTIRPKLPYSLSLEPDAVFSIIGIKTKVDLKINAFGENINGLDAVLLYDKKYLKPMEIVEVSPRFLVPRKMVRDDKIIITALRKLDDESPTSEEVVAEVYFTPLKKGQTGINFEFFPGRTIGSTIIKAQGSENILSEVRGARVEIK